MNKIILLLLFLIMLINDTKAQGVGEWTWMGGSSLPNDPGNYGIQGVASSTNNPPAKYEAVEWTDLNGNFWVFGGTSLILNTALWMYNPLTNQWTWMNGSPFSANAVYGTVGIPAPGNTPSCRRFGTVSWVDNSGDLWLFGGYGENAASASVVMNDLWRYNIATNQWTWMKGSMYGGTSMVYTGIKGVGNIANNPHPRNETTSGVTDSNGDLWMFGGLDGAGLAYNDVWKYNIATNIWTWMAGDQTHSNNPVYGAQNISSPTNDPGDRFSYTKFIDSQNNMYFLGAGLYIFGSGNVVDVWKFSPTTNEWTWVGGPNVTNYAGSLINKCDTVSLNIPKAKFEIKASWPDACGFFFLGGFINSDSYNDMWYYNVENNKFTWISGTDIPNDAGDYGFLGVSANTNMPRSRGGALGFKDKQSNLWMFGGLFFSSASLMSGKCLNDLWRFKLDTTCVKLCSNTIFNTSLTVDFMATTICGSAPFTLQFTNNSIGTTSYTWNFGDGSAINTATNPVHTYTANGTYTVSLTGTGTGTNTATTYKNAYIHVGALPTADFTILNNDTLCLNNIFIYNNTSQPNIISSAWDLGDGQIENTLNTFHYYQLPGNYTVSLVVTDNYGCVDTVQKNLTVLELPKALFNVTPDNGCKSLSVSFNNTSTNSNNYLWNFGDSQTSTSINSTHTYTASGTFSPSLIAYSIGCNDSAKTSIIVRPKPDANFTITSYDGCFPYTSIAFANTTGLSEYQWLINGVSTSINDSLSLGTVETISNKDITLITTNSFGCKDTVAISKKFTDDNCSNLYIPNVFTPNSDITNSLFAIKAVNYKSYHIIIYDRWGLKMFESTDSSYHWNGKPNNSGAECPEGTYFYTLNLTDKSETQTNYKGFLNLFR